jgi:hypothetical protein
VSLDQLSPSGAFECVQKSVDSRLSSRHTRFERVQIVTLSAGSTKSWPAFGAAIWSAIFGVFHIIWAMGWYVGLNAEETRKAFQVTWKLAFDIVGAGICVLGVFLALAFVHPGGRKIPRIVGFVGWCATGLLLLRSGGSIIQITYFAVVGRLRTNLDKTAVWELWFYLGAVLFGLSFWRFRRAIAREAV